MKIQNDDYYVGKCTIDSEIVIVEDISTRTKHTFMDGCFSWKDGHGHLTFTFSSKEGSSSKNRRKMVCRARAIDLKKFSDYYNALTNHSPNKIFLTVYGNELRGLDTDSRLQK